MVATRTAITRAKRNAYEPHSPRSNCRCYRLISKSTAIRMDKTWSASHRWRDWPNGSHKYGSKILGHVKRSIFMPVRMDVSVCAGRATRFNWCLHTLWKSIFFILINNRLFLLFSLIFTHTHAHDSLTFWSPATTERPMHPSAQRFRWKFV